MEKEALIQNLIKDGYLKTPEIISAFKKIDRADFVLPEYKSEAYGNYPLPINGGQTISQPLTVAFMLELLLPRSGDKILDIGAGSGWQTTLLAEIVGTNGRINAIERIPELCEFAQKNIDKYGFIKTGQVKFYCQDATENLPDGPYDKIIAAAAASKEIPQIWRDKLKIGGKIVAPIGGSIWLFIKRSEVQHASAKGYGEARWEEKEFPGFIFVPLIKGNPKSEIRNPKQYQNTKFEIRNAKSLKNVSSFVLRILNLLKTRLGVAILLFAGVIILTTIFLNEIYLPHSANNGLKSVHIESGLGSRQIGELLKKGGFIRSKWIFVTYVSLIGSASDLKPGDYVFSGASIKKITDDLIRGGTNEKSITIPEGWTIKEIAEYLEKENIIPKTEFEKLTDKNGAKKFAADFEFLKDRPLDRGLEGYLFPDTYRIFKDAKPEDIVKKMLENFDKKLSPELRAEIAKQKKSIFEIVIMASMIEREVVSDEDRAIVSDILWKRLENNIGLQVDATINYIKRQITRDTKQGNAEKISIADTKIDSPYNTYKYRGLPYGPISNPGLSAIKAAVYPKESIYFYYLSAPDGRTIFSKTFEEHSEAKRKYLN